MLSSIKNFLNALDENNIRYCHWKSNEHLALALDGDTDLDILFDPSQRNDLERVFVECGLKRFRSTALMQYNAIEDFIGFDQETAKIWHVHTHYRMTLGEKHLKGYTVNPWGLTLLNDSVRNEDNVWITDSSEEFVLLLSRIALKLRWRDFSKKIGKDDIAEINWLKSRISEDSVSVAANKLVDSKSSAIILSLLQVNLKKKKQLLRLQKSLRKYLKPFSSYNKFTSWITRSRRELYWFNGGVRRRLGLDSCVPNRRISPSGGLLVAVLGCDGAGKSTTLKYVYKEFKKKIDVLSVYFGSGDGSSSLVRKPMKVVAKKVGGKGVGTSIEKEQSRSKKKSFKSRMYSIAKIIWAISLAKEKKKKLKKVTRGRNNGLLVISDRYPQGQFHGMGDGPLLNKYYESKGLLKRISHWEQKIYDSFSINPPDLTIKLIVPTEVAIARKPEMTAEEIDRKKSIVMNLNCSNNTVIIDTSRPFEITRGEVMKAIWDLI